MTMSKRQSQQVHSAQTVVGTIGILPGMIALSGPVMLSTWRPLHPSEPEIATIRRSRRFMGSVAFRDGSFNFQPLLLTSSLSSLFLPFYLFTPTPSSPPLLDPLLSHRTAHVPRSRADFLYIRGASCPDSGLVAHPLPP